MFEREWKPLKFAEPGGHTGVMIGLWLPQHVASELAVRGYEPAEALHLTLLFLERDASELTDVDIAHLISCCDDVASFWPPVTGSISGLGRFYAKNDGGEDVIYATPDIPDISKLRERLAEYIGWEGLYPSDEHGFAPHITLAYVEPGASSPVDAVPMLPLKFDELTVCVGDRQTTVPFRGYPGDVCCTSAVELGQNGMFFTELGKFMEPPEWLPLLPAPGQYKHIEYGIVDLPAERIARLVASINDGVYQASIPINVSHNHDDLELNGALGHFGKARVNADGSADVLVDLWTPRGEEAIRAEKFRYVSPEFKAVWEDNQGEVHDDVVLGLALCPYPFFKDLAIDRAVVASERGKSPSLSFVYQFREPKRFVASEQSVFAPEETRMDTTNVDSTTQSENPTFPTYEQWKAVQVPGLDTSVGAYGKFLVSWSSKQSGAGSTTDTAATSETTTASEPAAKASDPKDSALELRFAEVNRKLEATTKELASERTTRQRKEFVDEIRGRSDDNHIQWFGEIDKHVAMLESFTDPKLRLQYIEQQRGIAKQMATLMGKEIGSDAPGDGADVMAEIDAKAQKYIEANPGTSKAKAITAVTEAEPKLAQRYREHSRK